MSSERMPQQVAEISEAFNVERPILGHFLYIYLMVAAPEHNTFTWNTTKTQRDKWMRGEVLPSKDNIWWRVQPDLNLSEDSLEYLHDQQRIYRDQQKSKPSIQDVFPESVAILEAAIDTMTAEEGVSQDLEERLGFIGVQSRIDAKRFMNQLD